MSDELRVQFLKGDAPVRRAPTGTRERLEQLGVLVKLMRDECKALIVAAVPSEDERGEGVETRAQPIEHAARALASLGDAWAELGRAHSELR